MGFVFEADFLDETLYSVLAWIAGIHIAPIGIRRALDELTRVRVDGGRLLIDSWMVRRVVLSNTLSLLRPGASARKADFEAIEVETRQNAG